MLSKIRGHIARWGAPAAAVAIVLIAVGIAAAVSSTGVKSGLTVGTLGDTVILVGEISSTDSSVNGIAFPTNAYTSAGVPDSNLTYLRFFRGSINASGVHSGRAANSADTTAATYSITFADSAVGTGSWTLPVSGTSMSYAGETNAEHAKVSIVLKGDTGVSFGNDTSDVGGGTLHDSGLYITSAANAHLNAPRALFGALNPTGAVPVTFGVPLSNGGFPAWIGGDTRFYAVVYNVQRDTFLSVSGLHDSIPTLEPILTWALGSDCTGTAAVKFETGTNYLFLVGLGYKGDSLGELKARSAMNRSTDSIAWYTGTVIISDTSTTGGGALVSGTPSAVTAVTASAQNTSTGDSSQVVVQTVVAGSPITITVDPISATSNTIRMADTATGGETHLMHGIIDVTVWNNAGDAVSSFTDPVTIRLVTTDTRAVVEQGLRLIYIDVATGQWRNLSELDTPDSSIEVLLSTDKGLVTLEAKVRQIKGMVVAIGAVSEGSTTAAGDGGTCLLEALFSGTSLEAALPMIRGARDLAMGSAAGRFAAFGYYAFSVFALLAFAGTAALAARK